VTENQPKTSLLGQRQGLNGVEDPFSLLCVVDGKTRF